jgi:hypothetical protein
MTDRELLELAAKAAGIEGTWDIHAKCLVPTVGQMWWNPLIDDGAALRLAVRLNIEFDNVGSSCTAYQYDYGIDCNEAHDNDPYAATRRAIVHAAAEIGKGMK